ncbi:MAG: hypothetical protein CL910_16840, partial [Deltaproteobacteria bacterium]|nr:hypothetical protein [Deltaproteobacteria bacterium]
AIFLAIVGAVAWQHLRYLKLRRERVDDRQPLLHRARAFHAITYMKVAPDRSSIDALRALRDAVERPGGGRVVYAGLVGMNMVASSQIPNDWSALALVQYPSREAYEATAARDDYRELLAGFEGSYTHGAIRGAGLSLMAPVGLLLLRLRDIVLRKPPIFPFEPAGDEALPAQKVKMKEVEQLDAFRETKDDAVVIFNLIQPGNEEQRKADRSYGLEMLRGMAEGSYGPMHIGRAVTVEGDARFTQFIAVYYPGIDHMHAMIGSTFISLIGSGKQLGDSLAVATIPVLSKL